MGGLENGLVNLINHTPSERYRHGIVSLTDITDFRHRLYRQDVPIYSLNKGPGQDFSAYGRLHRVLRGLHPVIVHTRNLGTLEYLITAAFAGVGGRVHGEHGRDMYDPDGLNFKYNLLRRAIRPFVHRYVAVSNDLADWLVHTVGVRPDRVTRICNGVDIERFRPKTGPGREFGPQGFAPHTAFVVGTIGRMEAVKDTLTLVRAFLHLVSTETEARDHLRLVAIGDGSLREEAQRLVSAAGAAHLVWFPGESDDIPELMRGLDLFVLPSLREGISNTILEAMASGLPVVATRVGGNPELVVEAETGMLVPASDPVAMAEAIQSYLNDPAKLERHGQAGRKRAETHFSIETMVNRYLDVYDAVLEKRRRNGRKPSRDSSESINGDLIGRNSQAQPHS
jgi:sugar transferase (PEP-CTERM/EpsH1 system associated)